MAKHTQFRKQKEETEVWYVMQVQTGMEERICAQCRRKISETVLEQCFIPRYEVKKHIQGVWKTQKQILFPGYVFVVTSDIQNLHEELKKVIGLTKLIGTGREIVPISENEKEFLLGFGGKEQVVQMSEGIITGSRVVIHSGPLKGKEGYIRKIDRHKRKAWLELPLLGGMQNVQVGLEIVCKK
ncbi:transcription termination/antitermination factor NusG [Marvinbryantia formatexigens DSM 14469]|uniref:Transcription termination/antitermination factor NusG n=1 Tax=Marvinbryantia formatexigens DSM 14469 TaxID=478749 RepID=C6LGB4_9FIRM|nr:antiterminator LoaP [Marvinbryantia formatexigens]EET60478.1 transcription termination/antitermination factor NusG [Marvinbryantia formatexigens DSM 14469]UWO24162.1 antiterminator LoaP [Marvinbryantia formatexigens DSM 14469]SDG70877.1 transcriptional antiterminator NusG [Marvinbryantia formatexigens]